MRKFVIGSLTLLVSAAPRLFGCESIHYWRCYPDARSIQASLDQGEEFGGKPSAHISVSAEETSERVSFFQSVKAQKYSGHTLKLSAHVKTSQFKGQVALAAVSYDGSPYLYLYSQPVKTSAHPSDWQHTELMFVVPREATLLSFGLLFKGAKGNAWLNQVHLTLAENCDQHCKSGVKSARLTHSQMALEQEELGKSGEVPGNMAFEAR